MNDTYFEAMEYHRLEQNDRKEKHGEAFSKWKQDHIIRIKEIEIRKEEGNLQPEDIDFLMQQATENIYMQWQTGEEFFQHHFDRIRKQQKIQEDISMMAELTKSYHEGLQDILSIPTPILGAKSVDAIKKKANMTLRKNAAQYTYFRSSL